MTETSFSKRFAASKGDSIEYQGKTVFGIYRRKVHKDDIIRVHFIRSNVAVREGLSVSITKGALVVNGQRLRDIILWMDTTPAGLEIVCQTPKSGAMLHVWNSWDQGGILQSWLGNAAMLIEEKEGSVILRCSDGLGDPELGDLVVELGFAPASDQVRSLMANVQRRSRVDGRV